MCSSLDSRLVGSNPAEVDGFFPERKNPESKERLQAVGPKSEISGSLKNLKPEKIGLLIKLLIENKLII
jgi:hypothetical protein